jgi:hypothetical protein
MSEPEEGLSVNTTDVEMTKLTPKLDFENPLKLTQDLGIRDSLARLIILQHGRLLIDLLRQLLL